MIRFNSYLLSYFHVVDALEDGESMANADNVHLLELFVLQSDQGFPNDLVLWIPVVSCCGS